MKLQRNAPVTPTEKRKIVSQKSRVRRGRDEDNQIEEMYEGKRSRERDIICVRVEKRREGVTK